jgi:hypothetical protein
VRERTVKTVGQRRPPAERRLPAHERVPRASHPHKSRADKSACAGR